MNSILLKMEAKINGFFKAIKDLCAGQGGAVPGEGLNGFDEFGLPKCQSEYPCQPASGPGLKLNASDVIIFSDNGGRLCDFSEIKAGDKFNYAIPRAYPQVKYYIAEEGAMYNGETFGVKVDCVPTECKKEAGELEEIIRSICEAIGVDIHPRNSIKDRTFSRIAELLIIEDNNGERIEFSGRTIHLKTDPGVFQDIADRRKTFELRWNDRDFKVGDDLRLRETSFPGNLIRHGYPLEYTGREAVRRISYVLKGPIYGLKDGWIIAGLIES